MQGTMRVTVSLPSELVETIDRKLAQDQSRSSFVRQLLQEALAQALERDQVEAYIRAYQAHPQTEEEHAWPDVVTAAALAEVQWD